MSNLNNLLRDIHARADSLALFAQHAARLDEQPKLKSEYVENVMQNLSALQCLQSDLLALVRAQLVAKMQGPANTQSYTDLNGKTVQVECLDWLEDGGFWEYVDPDDGDDESAGTHHVSCSRYCIGVDESGDGISVWLNCDMQEVEL